ncbi:mandelate racemase/muconate lactonizing enzyme family protein [Solirubrobacter ginsenosidimutans]|uniref:Mandelate racemase/muconate lactonizing enzyme family protein n=1 Tax=Solirubrobacter ginsenosidimutans TaxID=490573 RepID=A0A9X3MQD0_9ACTN|nr:mandelate racemase/muconate lactonizing enzyme family protein [Solirubrobacter ginsenosidimutans]MDA0160729.1 mandelate racemase/muconate lactonizing enzyme family protein [Solirubrobacter ginsenosidimutans]
MRIARVTSFGYDLHYAHGEYVMSGGRTITSLPSTIVKLETDDGLTGYGETCPLGPAYLPAHAGGARAALRELAPALKGIDPRNLNAVWHAMDHALAGHDYAKAAVDIACWDLLGKAAGLPVSTLLGGATAADFPLYVAIPLGPIASMVEHVKARRAEGIRLFQLKLGADPREDAQRVRAVLEATEPGETIIADANGGWRLQDATIAARALEDLDRVLFEQPCPTLEECLIVRERTTLPMVLDEVITDIDALLRARPAIEAINLKIGRVGGLTKAKLMRDLGQRLGLRFTIEDSWGGDVTTAAVAHLAASTAPSQLLTASFMNDWTLEHIAGYEPRSHDGRGRAPNAPGLGITVDDSSLTPLTTVD